MTRIADKLLDDLAKALGYNHMAFFALCALVIGLLFALFLWLICRGSGEGREG